MMGNLYLTPLDGEFHGREIDYWRYVDDIVILAASDRAAHRHLAMLERGLHGLGLEWKVPPTVEKITSSRGVSWLGVDIRLNGRRIPPDRVRIAERRLRRLACLKEGYSPYSDRLAQRLSGVISYYLSCKARPAGSLLRRLQHIGT